jgi:hypothetical protein
MVCQLSILALNVGGVLAEKVGIRGFIYCDGVDLLEVGFADVVEALGEDDEEQLLRSLQIIVVVEYVISFDDGLRSSNRID